MFGTRLRQAGASRRGNYTGIIALYDADAGTLPPGWLVCNGNDGTPDLRDRFIVCAGGAYSVGLKGGANQVELTMDQLPEHGHGVTLTPEGSHSHSSGTGGAHTHSSLELSSETHSHSAGLHSGAASSAAQGTAQPLRTFVETGVVADNTGSTTEGAHASSGFVGNTNTPGTHGSHTCSQAGGHSHSATSSSTGGGSAHENRPPFYSLLYVLGTEDADVWPEGIILYTELGEAPTGWDECDGSSGTPDLRDRFVQGAATVGAVGQIGGAEEIALTQLNMPRHSHPVTAQSAAGHQHAVNDAGGHSHGYTISNPGHSAHNHVYERANNTVVLLSGTHGPVAVRDFSSTGTGTHTHTVSTNSNSNTHSHPASSSTGGHSHTMTLGNSGDGTAHNNLPPYRAATFIKSTQPEADVALGVMAWWQGSILPPGFALCDGGGGRPDYRDRFVLGAGGAYENGDMGGSNQVTLTTAHLPTHAHGGSTTAGQGAHSHTLASTGNSHAHGGSGSTLSTGTHTHSGSFVLLPGTPRPHFQGANSIHVNRTLPATENAPAHSHSGSVSSAGGHTHTLPSQPTHNHDATSSSVGAGAPHENRPAFYAAAVIIRTT